MCSSTRWALRAQNVERWHACCVNLSVALSACRVSIIGVGARNVYLSRVLMPHVVIKKNISVLYMSFVKVSFLLWCVKHVFKIWPRVSETSCIYIFASIRLLLLLLLLLLLFRYLRLSFIIRSPR